MKPAQKNAQSGNVMIYILIAMALFGALTVTLSRQADQSDTQGIDEELAEFYAAELINYAATAKNVVDQMIATGSSVSDLDFVRPNQSSFDTGSHIHKVFHPQGGGLAYKEINENIRYDDNVVTPSGWYFKEMDVEWTPSTTTDIVFSAYRIKQEVCEKIQEKITGNTSVGGYVGATMYETFADQANPATLDSTFCPACDGYPMYCVGSTVSTFYSIIIDR